MLLEKINQNKNIMWLSFILLINITVKLIFIFNLDLNILNLADQSKYLRISQFILDNGYYPRMDNTYTNRMPLYPYFLYYLRSIFDNLYFIIIIQNLISCFSIFLVYNLSKLVYKKISILITFIFSINLNIILYTNLILTEAIFIQFFLIFFYFFIKFIKKQRFKDLVYSAIILAICTLIRPQTYYYPLLVFIFIFVFTQSSIIKKVIYLFIFATLFKLIIFSWEFRNYVTYGKFFLSTSNQTNLVGYYLPHFDQYEYNLDLVNAKKNRIEHWNQYLLSKNFQKKDFIDLEKIVITYTKEEFFKYNLTTITKVLFIGVSKNLFTPTFSDLSYWFNSEKTSFSKTKGNSFLEQFINYFKDNKDSRYNQILIISLIILFISRTFELIGIIHFFKQNYKLSIFFILTIAYFLILMGPIGHAKYRVPYEYCFAVYFSIFILKFKNFFLKFYK